jgi:HSP20 family molecular chaperone IbpA
MKLAYKPTLAESLVSDFIGNNWNPFNDQLTSAVARGNIVTGDTVRFNSSADIFTVEVDLPGAKREDTQVDITGSQVFITAKRNITSQSGKREETLTRSFALDKEADLDSIAAHQEDGVLVITAKRKNAERHKTRSLKIT